MRKFRDLDQVRSDLKSIMPLHEFIALVDGKSLTRSNDDLYKKRCNMPTHPIGDDGQRDSTASFTVCPSKGMYYCFGCGAYGDMFGYISTLYNLDHIESITKAAELCGLDLTPYYEQQTPEDILRDALVGDNKRAVQILMMSLMYSTQAHDYLLGRGISEESIVQFGLGYAPPITDSHVTIFNSLPNSQALQLIRPDQFNNAITFPVCDPYGNPLYFQTRPFVEPAPGMKYIGASESHPLRNVDTLYGLSVARKNIHKFGGRLVGVEGAPDAIICNQHEIPTVALLGTVMNNKTFELLDRFNVKDFILLLDGDKAGRDKSLKISEAYLSINTKVRLRVAVIPDGDPDEFVNTNGEDALIDLLDKSKYAIHYIFDTVFGKYTIESLSDKISFLNDVQKYTICITDPFIYKLAMQYIAELLHIDSVEVEDYYKGISTSNAAPLYSIDGEEVLLGEVLRNPEFMAELNTRFKQDDWYLARHKILFKIYQQAQYFDIDTIYTMVQNSGQSGNVQRAWLDYLYTKAGNVTFVLDDVVDKLIRRKARLQLVRMANDLTDMSCDPAVSLDNNIGVIYSTILNKTCDDVVDSKTQVTSTMSLINERMINGVKLLGYDLGPNFKKLTQVLLGLQTKTLTVIAANQSVGKTQLTENLAMFLATELRVPTLWFTLEMDNDRMTYRHLSILSGLPLTNVQLGQLTMQEKMERLDPAAALLARSPFYLNDSGHDAVEAMATARNYVIKKGVRVIVIDYVQLQHISSIRSEKRYQELGMISKGWKKFAKDMDASIVLISQLNRDAIDSALAKAEHGSGSYEIAQDADTYITLKERDTEEGNISVQNGNIMMYVDKNRMGTPDVLIPLYSERTTQRMMEV